jgi:subtilase family serine protease
VTVNVRNIAAAPAHAGPFKISLYLSNAPNATDQLIGSLNVVGALASALPLTVSGNVIVPPSTPAGSYYLSAVADAEGAIPDLSRANNLLTADGQIAIGRPDLSVTRVAGPAGGVGAAGQPMTVSADIKNEGPALANAGPFRVGFYLSDQATPGTGTLLGAVNVPGLAAGTRITLSPKLTVPPNLSDGDYFLIAIADIDNAIGESDKANNARSVTPDATIVIRQPNLAVLSATLTPAPVGGGPATVVPGQAFTVTASVRNTAEAPAIAGSFRVGAYLSTSPTGANPTLLGFATVASLAASTTTSVPISIKTLPPSLPPGSYYLVAIADDDGRIAESDEVDNTFVSATPQVEIKRADLVLTALSGPAGGLVGKSIAVSNTIVNQGTAPATAVRVSFFVSLLDATPGAGRLIGMRDIATLGATGSATAESTATTTLTLPANLAPGSYFLSAVVDLAGTVAESVESNNGLTADGQIVVTTAAALTR